MYSEDFIKKVRQLYFKDKNYRQVASKLALDHSTVRHIVRNDYERPKKKRGTKKIISSREKTKIKLEVKRLQSNDEHVFAHKIKDKCNIKASIRTLQRAMSELGFEYKKVQRNPPLTSQHKKQRVEFAREWIGDNVLNKNVVFTDEKRFSFDGPDNWFSWYDSFDPPQRIKRHLGGGSVMVWGMTLPTGEIYVTRLVGKVDSTVYCSMLRDKVVPYLNLRLGEGKFLFQQDNCKVHVSKMTKNYLETAKIKTIDWPSMSPDLNIQENIWKIISDEVYDQKQYDSAELLWQSIQEVVDDLNASRKETFKNIYNSYNKRLLDVIDAKGNPINY